MFLVAAAVACGPWFAKNWYFTGNPTYPLLYEVFGGATRTAEQNAQWEQAHRPRDFDLQSLARGVVDVAVRSEWLSLLVWPLAMLAVLALGDRRSWRLMGYVAYVLVIWWLFTHRIDRFWVPALAVVAFVAGAGSLWTNSRPQRIALNVFLAVGLLYSAAVAASGVVSYNRFFVSLDRLRVDPERVAAWHLWLNQHTPRGKQVLAVGDAQVFDLEPPVLYNTVFDDSVFEALLRGPDGQLLPTAELRQRLRDVAYVYVHWGEIARYRSPGNYGFTAFVQRSVFDELVTRGVLGRPVAEFANGAVQVFPVR